MIQFAPLMASVISYGAFRILASLGIGYITFTAANAFGNQIISRLSADVGSVTGSVSAIIQIAGFHTAVSMLIAAYSARMALKFVKQIGVIR